MPYYEFYCPDCHTIFTFFSRRVNTTATPGCPRCPHEPLQRRVSLFAIAKGRDETTADLPDLDDNQAAKLMAELERDMGGVDEDNPKAAAATMRKLFDATGMTLNAGMQEALGRLEAGDDPDTIEAELGDAMDEDEAIGFKAKPGLKSIRRMLPPKTDPEIYEL